MLWSVIWAPVDVRRGIAPIERRARLTDVRLLPLLYIALKFDEHGLAALGFIGHPATLGKHDVLLACLAKG